MSVQPRIDVIVPCYNDGEFVPDAVLSVEEDEPVNIVVVDDGSTDPATTEAVDALEAEGIQVLRNEVNLGISATRMVAMAETRAPFVFPLDADDLAIPGSLAALADALEATGADACFGDYAEFGDRELVREVPEELDPYRITYTNEYSASALFRRTALERIGGWTAQGTYEDWDVWMSFAERGMPTAHLGRHVLTHLRRIHGGRLGAALRSDQRRSYSLLRESHQDLFAAASKNRRRSTLSRSRRLLYPIVYGARRRLPGETYLKGRLDESRFWTLTRSVGAADYTRLTHSRLSELALTGGLDRGQPLRTTRTRISVVIPCFNDGRWIQEAVASIREREPVEIVIVDDASTDRPTRSVLEELERSQCKVVRLESNAGVSAARMRGLAETEAPYVFPLDADDVAMPRMLGFMADVFDSDPELGVCYGDYAEFEDRELIRAVPERIDPYRVIFTNEYPPSAMFRRDTLERVGGWRALLPQIDARSDWALWMSLAEAEVRGHHMGEGILTYARRMHSERLSGAGRRWHRPLYAAMEERHEMLFARAGELRGSSPMETRRKLLYPIVYGGRRRFSFEPVVKSLFDWLGIWTLKR